MMTKTVKNEYIHTLALESCLKLNRMLENSPIEELLSQALEEGVRLTRSRIGFLHFINQEANRVEQHLWSNETLSQCSIISQKHYPIDEAGLWTDCLKSGEPVIHNNYLSEPRRRGLPDGHPPLSRFITAPLKEKNRVMAVMGVANKETDYEPEDVQSLSLLTETTWNIVRRKRAEDALKRSESHYRILVENLPLRLFLKDNKSVYISCNSNYAHDFGLEPEEMTGKNDFNFFPRDIAAKYRADDRRIMRNGVTEELIEEYINKKHQGWAQTIKTPIRDDKGQITGILGLFWDITPRKRAEQKLECSLKEKEVLLKEIHHRVRNNLQLIVSLLHWQLETISSHEALDVIRQTISRIFSIAMAHEKLYQSKDLGNIPFKEYLEYMVGWLMDSIPGARGVKLSLKIENIPLSVDLAIPCGLILTELLTNSLKHAFPGDHAPAIHIHFHSFRDGTLQLSFSDNGIGFSFDPLEEPEPKTLGLQLIKTLAQQIQGVLTSEREPNGGARFTLRFSGKERENA